MKKYVAMLVLLFLPLVAVAPAHISAESFNPLGNVCDTLAEEQSELPPDERKKSAACEEAAIGQNGEDPISGSSGIIERVANILAIVTAVIAVIIIVIAGITMTLSGGDSTKVQNSRNAIIYSAVGLVIVALARTIVVFVVNRL